MVAVIIYVEGGEIGKTSRSDVAKGSTSFLIP